MERLGGFILGVSKDNGSSFSQRLMEVRSMRLGNDELNVVRTEQQETGV